MNPFANHDVHVEVERSSGSTREHIVSPDCWCQPKQTLRDLRTGRLAWRHFSPPNPPRSERTR